MKERSIQPKPSITWQSTSIAGGVKPSTMSTVKLRKSDNTPCQIEKGLFLGSKAAAVNKDESKRLNITHILTVTRSVAPAYPKDFKYKVIRVDETVATDIAKYFGKCLDFIEEAMATGGGVLVHCVKGRSRSVTIVVAYLMKVRRMKLREALTLVRSKRPKASPNAGFVKQLKEFEKSLLDYKEVERLDDQLGDGMVEDRCSTT